MYRWAENEDQAAVMALWAQDFESYEPYYSWYFKDVYQPTLTLCDFDGPRLLAMLQLAPYTLALRGTAVQAAYLVGVITDPAFRGQGRGQALLGRAHDWLREQGYLAALLYTDIPGFYQPLGYRHCYQRHALDLPAAQFPLFLLPGACQGAWRAGDLDADMPAVAEIYTSMTKRYDGYIRRTREDWQKYLGEHNCDGALLTLAGEQAYLLYTLDQEKLRIIELGFADAGFLAGSITCAVRLAEAAGAARLIWPAPFDAPQLLPQIPAKLWQPQPFVMARWLEEPAAVRAFNCPAAERQILARLDTAALTKLLFGVEGALAEDSKLMPEERQRLAERFPPLPLWVNEYT